MPSIPADTCALLAGSTRGWPHAGDPSRPLKEAAQQLRQDGSLVIECEGMAGMALFNNGGGLADVDWRDEAV